jgi:hypothetical protein
MSACIAESLKIPTGVLGLLDNGRACITENHENLSLHFFSRVEDPKFSSFFSRVKRAEAFCQV